MHPYYARSSVGLVFHPRAASMRTELNLPQVYSLAIRSESRTIQSETVRWRFTGCSGLAMCAEVAVETPTQFSMEGAMAAKFHFSGPKLRNL